MPLCHLSPKCACQGFLRVSPPTPAKRTFAGAYRHQRRHPHVPTGFHGSTMLNTSLQGTNKRRGLLNQYMRAGSTLPLCGGACVCLGPTYLPTESSPFTVVKVQGLSVRQACAQCLGSSWTGEHLSRRLGAESPPKRHFYVFTVNDCCGDLRNVRGSDEAVGPGLWDPGGGMGNIPGCPGPSKRVLWAPGSAHFH